MLHDHTIVYGLKGRSLEAALTLNQKMRAELLPAIRATMYKDSLPSVAESVTMVWPTVKHLDAAQIGPIVRALRQGDARPFVDAFREKYKDLYDATGQNSRAIKIKKVDGGYPRAYAHTPEVYFHPGDDQKVYMYSPFGYKTDWFVPEDGVAMDYKDAEILTRGLWANGHSEPVPVIHRKAPYGVQTPADYDPVKSMYERHPAPFDHKQTARLLRAFNYHKDYLVQEKAIVGVDNADDFKFLCQIVTESDGRPGLLAKAVHQEKGHTLTMKANACFTPEDIGTGFYRITPHPKTAGGLALQSFFDEIPPLPAEDIWKICDEDDKCHFIKPPPPPRELLHLDSEAPWPLPRSSPALP